jgi:predicted acylesterase/phospholipase RssA
MAQVETATGNAPAPPQANDPAEKRLDCDIVMAGGVTSGIIYPGAVAMIARRYAFHSIGGTSVGAIAAAITGAAEYGRRTGGNASAFDELEQMPKELGQYADDGHTRLFHLFTAEPATRRLLSLIVPVFSGGKGRAKALLSALSSWQIAIPTALALLAGLAAAYVLCRDGHGLLALAAGIAACALALVILTVMFVVMLYWAWLPAWRANFYGICTGLSSPSLRTPPGAGPFEGLTPWIHRKVQSAAGRPLDHSPMTFGDLWSAPDPDGKKTQGNPVVDPANPRSIDLVMVASDISRNRSAQLPFLETPSTLYIEKAVLVSYFPPPIVEWMLDNAGSPENNVEQRCDVIRLPKPQDLPIVFGARLSLSFPFLLAAVPLMTPDYAHKPKGEPFRLRRVWFSDGGLTSNFPVHFFDSPVPSRPTFCLNLIDYESDVPVQHGDSDADMTEEGSPDADQPVAQARSADRAVASRPRIVPQSDPRPGDVVWKMVSMATGNNMTPAPFTSFDEATGAGLLSFIFTLVNTARFWSDNEMVIAPGIRERVVNIALRPDEGGLNLDMPANTLDDLDYRGRAAGLLIAARFDPLAASDPKTGKANVNVFANHRWVRFRNFMASFEDSSRRFATSRRKSDVAAVERRESVLDTMIAGQAREKIGYPVLAVARDFFRRSMDALEQLALTMAAATRANKTVAFDQARGPDGKRVPSAAPRPSMRARLRPLANDDPRAEIADLPDPR